VTASLPNLRVVPQKRKKQRRVASQRPPAYPGGASIGDLPGAGMPSNFDVIEGRISDAGTIRSRALATLTEDAGASRSSALAALAGKKLLPPIRAGIVDYLSEEDQKTLEEKMAKASQTISGHFESIDFPPPELRERMMELGQRAFRQQRLAGETVVLPPSPQPPYGQEQQEKPRNKARRRPPAREQIAKRVFKRHRQEVVSFLKEAALKIELDELGKVEAEVTKGSKRSCMHAAYSARVLLEGLANHLFPPTSKKWRGRDKQERSLGARDFKNRLIAYVERELEGQMEGEEFRAFVGTLDVVMRWTGGGPHGSHEPQDAEHLYTRMIDALSVIARAHAVGSTR
jgi:hypothetical protein